MRGRQDKCHRHAVHSSRVPDIVDHHGYARDAALGIHNLHGTRHGHLPTPILHSSPNRRDQLLKKCSNSYQGALASPHRSGASARAREVARA